MEISVTIILKPVTAGVTKFEVVAITTKESIVKSFSDKSQYNFH